MNCIKVTNTLDIEALLSQLCIDPTSGTSSLSVKRTPPAGMLRWIFRPTKDMAGCQIGMALIQIKC